MTDDVCKLGAQFGTASSLTECCQNERSQKYTGLALIIIIKDQISTILINYGTFC